MLWYHADTKGIFMKKTCSLNNSFETMKKTVLALAVACAHSAFCGTYTWKGGGEAGDWSDAANWQSEAGGCPGAGDTALFNSTVEISSALEISTVELNSAVSPAPGHPPASLCQLAASDQSPASPPPFQV